MAALWVFRTALRNAHHQRCITQRDRRIAHEPEGHGRLLRLAISTGYFHLGSPNSSLNSTLDSTLDSTLETAEEGIRLGNGRIHVLE